MADLKIGALAENTGTSAPTIRYYEDIGLLPRADRCPGGDPENLRETWNSYASIGILGEAATWQESAPAAASSVERG